MFLLKHIYYECQLLILDSWLDNVAKIFLLFEVNKGVNSLYNFIIEKGEVGEISLSSENATPIPSPRVNFCTQKILLSSEEFVCKVATTVGEASDLIESVFEHVTEVDGVRLLRKRK